MADDKISIDPQPNAAFDLEQRRMNLKAGWLGRVFGDGAAAKTNICGVLVVLLVLLGALTQFMTTRVDPLDYWKAATPLLTLALGYLFGRHD